MKNNNASAGLLLACTLILSACSDTPSGQVRMNQSGGLEISAPEFLQSRAINRGNLDARVSVVSKGITYVATQTQSGPNWVGELFVPEGSNAVMTVMWVETGVPDLPDELNGELPLAQYNVTIPNIMENRAIEILTEQYVTESSEERPIPRLDIDEDGDSNLEERMAGSRPNDALDRPAVVTILYNASAPMIDGRYDSIWANAQFLDQDRNPLNIDKIMLDDGVTEAGEDRGFKWAGMHDGEYLYLLIFGEEGDQQTPFGDSVLAYNDDAVDIYWDGDNSKLASYDGVDDFQAIIALLSNDEAKTGNRSGSPTSRFELGDRSTPIDESAFEFAVCLCKGGQQIYEVRLELAAAKIPIDSIIGFEIQLNNDVNGGVRDAKWAWFDESGADNTWRFPLKMGTARLEPLPF